MGTIAAIGGGDFSNMGTYTIDEYIVKLSGKKHPKALFIPTASEESPVYIDAFNSIYGEKLGCITDALLIMNGTLTESEIEHKILTSDIIYVGGGNTKKMLDIWHEYKVDKYLKEAYEKGVLLSGLSAGSICWFKYGYSDSFINENGSSKFGFIEGLGLINAAHCPHYDEKDRKGFDKMMSSVDEIGIALENNCCIVFKDDTYRIIKSDEKACAYKFYISQGKVYKVELASEQFADLKEL